MDCSLSGSSVHGIFQVRILEWVAIFLLQGTCRSLLNVSCIFSSISSVQLLSHVRLFAAPWTVACQASPSMGFSRQEYWSGLPFPSPRLDLLAVQRTLKSLLQHHSSKASVLRHSAFFIVQFSHPYVTDYWKNHSFD